MFIQALFRYMRSSSTSNRWDIRHVKNLGEVVPDKIYRSANPDEAIRELREKLRIKTIVDLRDSDIDSAYQGECEKYKIRRVHIPMSDKALPSREQIDFVLEVFKTKSNYPILVHCIGGRHRTGGCVARYRVEVEGWDVAKAEKEAIKFGFYSEFGHRAWEDVIRGNF